MATTSTQQAVSALYALPLSTTVTSAITRPTALSATQTPISATTTHIVPATQVCIPSQDIALLLAALARSDLPVAPPALLALPARASILQATIVIVWSGTL